MIGGFCANDLMSPSVLFELSYDNVLRACGVLMIAPIIMLMGILAAFERLCPQPTPMGILGNTVRLVASARDLLIRFTATVLLASFFVSLTSICLQSIIVLERCERPDLRLEA